MRSFLKLTLVQLKLYIREPAAFFFTLVFPALILVLFGLIWGNDPAPPGSPFPTGYGFIDVEVPALSAMIIGSVALLGVPIATSSAREQKVLRRYQATPMPSAVYLAADIAVYFLVSLMGMVILVLIGKIFFSLRFAGNWFNVLGGFGLGIISFIAVGYLIASLAPTSRIAQVVGNLVYFPMFFLSGAAIPLNLIPENVRQVSDWLPMTQIVLLMQDLWFGNGWQLTAVAVLAGMMVLGLILSARTFRWE